MRTQTLILLSIMTLAGAAAWAGPCSHHDHNHNDSKNSVTQAELHQGPFICLNSECSQVAIYESDGQHGSKVETHVLTIAENLRADVRDARTREIDLGVCSLFGEAVGYPAFRE